MNRRKFIQNSILTTSALAITNTTLASFAGNKRILKDKTSDYLIEEIDFINASDRMLRVEKAALLMQKNSIDAIFIESGTSLEYFTGIKWWPSERLTAALIHSDGSLNYICPAYEEERLIELITLKGDIFTWQEHQSPFGLLKKIFQTKGLNSGILGIEESVRFFLSNGIKKELTGFKRVDAKPITSGCRVIKSRKELALMKKANQITLQAYKKGFSQLKEGMSQYDLDTIISNSMSTLGATGMGYVGSTFGKYTSLPHGSSTAKNLKEGDIILVDGGCKYGGYQADITRTTIFGKPNQKQTDVWNTVKEAQSAVYDVAKPGVPCELLDATARKIMNKRGYGTGYTNFFHRVGHGVGMDFHEWEYLVKGNNTILQPGMCFSNEPGLYLTDEFGVRIEDCFHITENGYEAFTPQSLSIENPI